VIQTLAGQRLQRLPAGPDPEIKMPNVMIRRKPEGDLLFYIAKKDQEDVISKVEVDNEEQWGGEVELTDGSRYYIDPVSPPPQFPTTLRFKRAV
jgi:nitrogen fixation protein NifT